MLAQIEEKKKTITRLARVGFDNSLGYLKGGVENWISHGKITENLDQINIFDFEEIYNNEELLIYDVRSKIEFNTERLLNSINVPLNNIQNNFTEFSKNNKFYIHCQTGYRSVIAASFLKSKGIKNLVNIESGFEGIRKTKIKRLKKEKLYKD